MEEGATWVSGRLLLSFVFDEEILRGVPQGQVHGYQFLDLSIGVAAMDGQNGSAGSHHEKFEHEICSLSALALVSIRTVTLRD